VRRFTHHACSVLVPAGSLDVEGQAYGRGRQLRPAQTVSNRRS